MKQKTFFVAACLFALVAYGQPETSSLRQETPEQHNARMAWWREARFGMFIHWGVYSVPAGTYHGNKIDGLGEWIMYRGKIPMAEYQQYARQFNPTNFNADDWVKIAKNAGMKYIVITAKHHDGFAMFDSKASDWNIVKATPFGRDPLKELAVACQKQGIRLGFYYSQAQDWNNGGSAYSSTWDSGGNPYAGLWDPAQKRDMDAYIRDIAVPQVRELLSNYGKISVLWFDTPIGMNKERADAILPLLPLQPGLVWNDRLGGGYKGDTETPEQYIPATGLPNHDWETCMTINDTWGYKSYDDHWKDTQVLIRNLIDCASKGGNYLLNVGPTSEGLIPEPSVERLAEIGQWMNINGEAIYGTQASPFDKTDWGRCTRKKLDNGNTRLYLHVFRWPEKRELQLPSLASRPVKAFLLDGKKTLKVSSRDKLVTIALPAEMPDTNATVIALDIEGDVKISSPASASR